MDTVQEEIFIPTKNAIDHYYESNHYRELVNLMATIIVEFTLNQIYEKSNPLSPLQP